MVCVRPHEQSNVLPKGSSAITHGFYSHRTRLDKSPRNADPLGASLPHQWFRNGQEPVDPAKQPTAQERRLKNNTTTFADESAKQGYDWEF